LFDSLSFFVFGLNSKGGCSNKCKNHDKFHYKNRTVKLISPKSSNDNCLFMCFAYHLEIKGNTLKFDDIRKELNIPEGKIHIKEINKISDHFNTGFILLNEKQEVILYKDIVNQPKVHIMLMNEHYYVVEKM
jgi:ABC-type bacteriocin/lantibiotic exporter with double-glycine peptidase domain